MVSEGTCPGAWWAPVFSHTSTCMCLGMGGGRTEVASKLESFVRQSFKVGKLNLVDLAGSERVRLSGATGASESYVFRMCNPNIPHLPLCMHVVCCAVQASGWRRVRRSISR